jgi:flagellin
MSLSIRTNVASINAQRNLASNQGQLNDSMARLSSGLRITKAGDDAAGLGISTNLEAQIKSYGQAARNANDGISLVQTAEGSMNEVSNILSRLRELAMQSASDGVGSDGRSAISTEAGQLTSELDRINTTTEFNGNKFLGASTALSFQVGIRGTTSDVITVDTSQQVDSATLGTTALKLNSIDLGTDASTSQSALAAIDAAITTVSSFRAQLGAAGNRLQSVVNTIQTATENLSAADSRIRDVDVAAETSALSRSQVLAQAGISVLAQANQAPQMALKLLG